MSISIYVFSLSPLPHFMFIIWIFFSLLLLSCVWFYQTSDVISGSNLIYKSCFYCPLVFFKSLLAGKIGGSYLTKKSHENRSRPSLLLHFEPNSAQNGRPEIIVFCVGRPVHVFALPSSLSTVSIAVTTYLTLEDCLSWVWSLCVINLRVQFFEIFYIHSILPVRIQW